MNQTLTPEAEEHLRRAIHARPNDWPLRHRVAEMLFRSGRDREASELYTEGPGFWEDRDLVFQLVELGNQYAPTINVPLLKQWLETHPDDLEGHQEIAKAYAALGKTDEAQSHDVVSQTLKPQSFRRIGHIAHPDSSQIIPDLRSPEPGPTDDYASPPEVVFSPVDEPLAFEEITNQEENIHSESPVPHPPPPPSLLFHENEWSSSSSSSPDALPIEIASASFELPTLHGNKSKKNRAATAGALATAIALHALILFLLGVIVIALPDTTPPEITATIGSPDAPIADPQQKLAPLPSPQVNTSTASLPSVSMLTSHSVSQISVPSVEVSNTNANLSAGFGVNLSGVGFSSQSSSMSGGATFFGVQSKGATVIIIDISGSMLMGGRDYGRIEKEAIRALKSMPKNAQFNVILFARDAIAFKPKKLVAADDKSIPECIQWLQGYSPELRDQKRDTKDQDWAQYRNGLHSGTYSSKAFDVAFEMKPSEIIYLSDGEPTGEFFPADLAGKANLAGKDAAGRVHELVRVLQLRQKTPIKVNTISYRADGKAEAFMDQLAKDNAGKFKNLR